MFVGVHKFWMWFTSFYPLSHVAELAQKARKEIADYLSSGKDERARIRVEHIIREDYLVEAMEILELYCDLLLARFGLIQTMKLVLCSTWSKYIALSDYTLSGMTGVHSGGLFSLENWIQAYRKQCPPSSGQPLVSRQRCQS